MRVPAAPSIIAAASLLASSAAAGLSAGSTVPSGTSEARSDAFRAWVAAGRPTEGVHAAGGWVLSAFRQPVDPASRGFEAIEIAGCKQEAVLQLVLRCAGEETIAPSLTSPLREVVEDAFNEWYSGKVITAGASWVEATRRGEHDLVVLALPEDVCASIPKRADWRTRAPEVASVSKSWIVTVAIAQVATAKDADAIRARATEQLRGSLVVPGAEWPEAFIKFPGVVSEQQLAALSLGELARLAALRPGDLPLWRSLVDRCERSGLPLGAEAVREITGELKWPDPAPTVEPDPWMRVEVGDLPPHLVAIVRHRGAIPAKAALKSEAEEKASEAYFATPPRLAEAEALAREACSRPSADALNLLAAIRLADDRATSDALLQALAFSTQASALDAQHPYARVNAARAMQRLGWRAQVKLALEAMPRASGAWQQRELNRLSEWLREP